MRSVVRWARSLSDHELQQRADAIVMYSLFAPDVMLLGQEEQVLMTELVRRVRDHAAGRVCLCWVCDVNAAAGPDPEAWT